MEARLSASKATGGTWSLLHSVGSEGSYSNMSRKTIAAGTLATVALAVPAMALAGVRPPAGTDYNQAGTSNSLTTGPDKVGGDGLAEKVKSNARSRVTMSVAVSITSRVGVSARQESKTIRCVDVCLLIVSASRFAPVRADW